MPRGSAKSKSVLTFVKTTILFGVLGAMLLAIFVPRADAEEPDTSSPSVLATWNCTSSPCPWGSQTAGQAAVWPASAQPTRARHGYTVSHDVYAPAAKVVGWEVTVTAGSGTVYAGAPNDAHGSLGTLNAGQSFTVPALSAGAVVSVQGGEAFRYTFAAVTPPTEGPTEEPTAQPTGQPTTQPTTQPTSQPTGQPVVGTSVLATWNCTGSPCPWGSQTAGQAAVWPASAQPTRARHGYTVSHDVYAAAHKVVGWEVTVTAGSATVYAGAPNDAHGSLATLNAGQSFTVPAVSAGAVVSLQGGGEFRYTLASVTPPTEGPTEEPTAEPTASPTQPTASPTQPTATPTQPTATPTQPTTSPTTQNLGDLSVVATWNCTGTPCPWGDQTAGQAAVWPAAAQPTRARHGYTVSHDVYAAAHKVVGWAVTVTAGSASVYAGAPNDSHGFLASLDSGQTFTVPALSAGAVVSLQGGGEFRYTLTAGTPPTGGPTVVPTEGPTGGPTEEPSLDCTDPTTCDPVSSVQGVWRYVGSEPEPDVWQGGVIAWPSWSAFSGNNRPGTNSRTVFSESGEKLYPYMGEWADGCQIEVVSGNVLIVEWQRGLDEWRETNVSAGGSHTINLTGSENGAMIEAPNTDPFEVSLSNCTPQVIDKGSSD